MVTSKESQQLLAANSPNMDFSMSSTTNILPVSHKSVNDNLFSPFMNPPSLFQRSHLEQNFQQTQTLEESDQVALDPSCASDFHLDSSCYPQFFQSSGPMMHSSPPYVEYPNQQVFLLLFMKCFIRWWNVNKLSICGFTDDATAPTTTVCRSCATTTICLFLRSDARLFFIYLLLFYWMFYV